MTTPAWWPTADQKERADKAHSETLAAKTSRALPRPLVVWDNTVPCDRCDGDVRVITDGRRVAATTNGHPTDEPERDGVHLSIQCQNNGAGVEDRTGYLYCQHTVTVDLSTEHWTTLSNLIDRLMVEGVDIP